jgi:hypothetical protein
MVLLQAFLINIEADPKVVAVSWVVANSPEDAGKQVMTAWTQEGVAPTNPEEGKKFIVHLLPLSPLQIPGRVVIAPSMPMQSGPLHVTDPRLVPHG